MPFLNLREYRKKEKKGKENKLKKTKRKHNKLRKKENESNFGTIPLLSPSRVESRFLVPHTPIRNVLALKSRLPDVFSIRRVTMAGKSSGSKIQGDLFEAESR